MNSDIQIYSTITTAIDQLPVAARPYLLVLLAGEEGLDPLLLDGLNVHLADAHDHIDEQHYALHAAHLHHKAGNHEAAARQWGAIDYAGTADEARAAARFMAGLPALIQAAQDSKAH